MALLEVGLLKQIVRFALIVYIVISLVAALVVLCAM